jgi:hypothetical protein
MAIRVALNQKASASAQANISFPNVDDLLFQIPHDFLCQSTPLMNLFLTPPIGRRIEPCSLYDNFGEGSLGKN